MYLAAFSGTLSFLHHHQPLYHSSLSFHDSICLFVCFSFFFNSGIIKLLVWSFGPFSLGFWVTGQFDCLIS